MAQVYKDESSGRVIKFIALEDPLEALFYGSVSHYSILKPLDRVFNEKGIEIHMPLGKDIHLDAFARRDNSRVDGDIFNIINALLYLERNGIIYGDVKHTNVVRLDDDIKVIDFGLLAFRNHSIRYINQTYGDSHSRNFDPQTYHPGKDLIWSLGITVASLVAPNVLHFSDMTYEEYILKLEGITLEDPRMKSAPARWRPFLVKTFEVHSKRPHLIEDIISLVPGRYLILPSQSLHLAKTPNLPASWHSQLSVLLLTATSCLVDTTDHPEAIFFFVSMSWRYLPLFLQEDMPENTQPLSKDISRKALSFFCAMAVIAADLFNQLLVCSSIAYGTGCILKPTDVKLALLSIYSLWSYRLPSYLFELNMDSKTMDIDAIAMTISDPQSYTKIRDQLLLDFDMSKRVEGTVGIVNAVLPKSVLDMLPEDVKCSIISNKTYIIYESD